MSNQPELVLQQKCYKWWHNTYPELRGCLWRIENERKRSKYEQMIAKSTGLVSGVADLNMLYNGVFYGIELKTETGRQSDSQAKWQRGIEAQGGKYIIIRSEDEFKEFIIEIITDTDKGLKPYEDNRTPF